ncbi:MAG: aspartate aminotransferase family protein, partial [Solirubrobacteraceae bacterium]
MTIRALVTGCQMAHVTALAAARHGVFAHVGWDVGERGLIGAPSVLVLAGAERHITVDRALRLLGFGTGCVTAIPADGQGRMVPAAWLHIDGAFGLWAAATPT